MQHRHAPDQWSIAEYADHVREVLFAMRFVLGMALTTDEPDLGPAPTPKFSAEPRVIDFDAALGGVGEEGALLADELAGLDMQQWARARPSTEIESTCAGSHSTPCTTPPITFTTSVASERARGRRCPT